jgi:ADP-ribose pyrophosphatase YjhB (NUDIX family)
MVKAPTTNITPRFPRPMASVDTVIFSIGSEALQVLLVQRPNQPSEPFPGMWALPGGFIQTDRDRDLESCARQTLRAKTGVESPYLEQLGSWGSAGRDPRGWSTTHVYFALLQPPLPQPSPGGNAADARWFRVIGQGVHTGLAFDHNALLTAALQRLRSKVEYTSMPSFLLPAEFTLSELQHTYEVMLERSLEKKSFRTRIVAAGLIETVPRMKSGSNRPAQLYRLKHRHQLHYFARPFGSATAD